MRCCRRFSLDTVDENKIEEPVLPAIQKEPNDQENNNMSENGDVSSDSPKISSDNRSVSIKTPWEEGLDCIDSLLKEGSATCDAMTDKQRDGLKQVKKMLLSASGANCGATNHVPKALLKTAETSRSSFFLLSEYGGYTPPPPPPVSFTAIVKAHSLARKLSKRFKKVDSEDAEGAPNIPKYWAELDEPSKLKLRDLLSWENISKWNFNVFDVHEVLNGKHTLVFVSWAILCSPDAQYSMDMACRDFSGEERALVPTLDAREGSGYGFFNKGGLGIREKTLIEFFCAIEERYNSDIPYHNEVHAADVTQSLHAMLQMGAKDFAKEKWELFSVLLAAVGHDVGHCGYNNNYHINSSSKQALMYNDDAVLENMHSAIFFRLFMGQHKVDKLNIMDGLDEQSVKNVREFIIMVILNTDMTKHFKKINFIKGILPSMNVGCENGKHAFLKEPNVRHEILSFLCHMADISNPSKEVPITTQWAKKVVKEFYRQGDKERELGMPISPGCDRNAQTLEECQIGFISFIVLPSFQLLGQLLPAVQTTIVPQIEQNLEYWKQRHEQNKNAATTEADESSDQPDDDRSSSS